jgi:hypothetical protein
MSVQETLQLITRSRREGVTLFARSDGKLGWRANPRPHDALLVVLKEHKADILALLPPPPGASPALGPAKAMIARLRGFGFRPYLNDQGVLLIADATGKNRDVSRFMSIATVFDTLVAGLADDSTLLDPMTEEERQ